MLLLEHTALRARRRAWKLGTAVWAEVGTGAALNDGLATTVEETPVGTLMVDIFDNQEIDLARRRQRYALRKARQRREEAGKSGSRYV